MDLLLRRRQMFSVEKEPEGGRLSDYVQDGLVLHMDGAQCSPIMGLPLIPIMCNLTGRKNSICETPRLLRLPLQTP